MLKTMPTAETQNDEKKKKLGVVAAMAYVVANVIGTGIFITPTSILRNTNSVGLSLCVWAACAVMSLIGSMSYIELGTSIRRSGADYAYQTYVGWSGIAFGLSFTYVLFGSTASNALLLGAIADYILRAIGDWICLSPWAAAVAKKLIGLLVIYLLTFLNFYSLEKFAAKVQIVALFLKVTALAVISVTGIYYFISGKATDAFSNPMEGTSVSMGSLVSAFYSGFFAYSGWDAVNYGIEDLKNPRRNLAIAAAGGTVIVAVCYIFTNVAYFAVLGKEGMLESDAVAYTFCAKAYGPVVAAIMPGVIGIMAATTVNANLFITSRLMFATARRGHFPRYLSALTPDSDSPRPALASFVLLITVMFFIGSLDTLLQYAEFVEWTRHLITMAALIWMRFRKIPVHKDALRVPMLVHVVFFLMCVYLVVVPVIRKPEVNGIGAAFVGAGVIIYLIFIKNKKLPSFLFTINNWLTKAAQILFVVTPHFMTDGECSEYKKTPSIASMNERQAPSSPTKQNFVERF